MIRRRRLLATLLACVILDATLALAAAPQPVAKISLDEVASLLNRDASPVFLSDDSIGLLVRSGRPRDGVSRVVVFRWTGGKLRPVASTSKTNEGDQVFSASG